jgi:hypothetical protein
MDMLPRELLSASQDARRRLSQEAVATAQLGAHPGSRAAMAGAAREAIFADALLGAMHARLEELKGAAK